MKRKISTGFQLAALLGVITLASRSGALSAEPSDAVQQLEKQRIAAIARAKRAAVSVFGPDGGGGGSGVVITPDGYALTNYHVSKPAGVHMRCGMPDGEIYDAVIVGIDPTGDVALIKLLGRDDFPTATMADSDNVRAGDWCFAVGNPFLLATDLQPTVSWGIVSGVHRYQYPAGTLLEYADCIQTDAAINPGNSGGPLFNAEGELIGINGRGSFEKRGRVNVGVGYAISINQIKHFMGYLRSGRIVDHATLGASVSTDQDDRVVVNDILDTSDAYRRGLRYGDEIVAFGGRPIATVNAFKNVLGIFPKGWRVPLSYRRDGVRHDVHVRLEGVHIGDELIAKVEGPGPKLPQPPEQPEDDDPEDENPEKGKRQPLPRIFELFRKEQKLPEDVKAVYEARRGYANYYFNKLNLHRVWNATAQRCNLTERHGEWQIKAEIESDGELAFTLTNDHAALNHPGGETIVDMSKDLDTQLGPADSGGMLTAVALWRRLMLQGPQKYGDVYYLGTAPSGVGEPFTNLVDVLVATYDVTETHFMFSPETGRLVGMEMFPAPDTDPCTIYFSDFRDTEHGELPHRWEVRHGDGVYTVMVLKGIQIPPAMEKDA